MERDMKKSKHAPKQHLIGLTKLVDVLKRELFHYAEAREQDYTPLFKIKEATVEVAAIAKEDDKVQGNIKIYLANIGAKIFS